MATPHLEIEIKLNIADAAIAKLYQHPLLQTAQGPKQQQLVSTYFDTPTQTLRKSGFTIRVRQVDAAHYIQTLKGPAANNASSLAARSEWEWPIAHATPELALIEVPALQSLLTDPTFLSTFTARFTTEFNRTLWDITLTDGTIIELVLDQGEIKAGEQTTKIQEVELELKNGNPEVMKALANLLAIELKLQPEPRSKAARGFALTK